MVAGRDEPDVLRVMAEKGRKNFLRDSGSAAEIGSTSVGVGDSDSGAGSICSGDTGAGEGEDPSGYRSGFCEINNVPIDRRTRIKLTE